MACPCSSRSNEDMGGSDSDVSRYNIRKSLKTPMHRPTNVYKKDEPLSSQRKTLIHSKIENYNHCEDDDLIRSNGFQNSCFNLHTVENKLAHLAQIHLVLEHMLMIRSTLDLENGNTNFISNQSLASFHREKCFCTVYSSFLDDIKKPAKRFHLLADQKVDRREIVVMNPKILSKIDG